MRWMFMTTVHIGRLYLLYRFNLTNPQTLNLYAMVSDDPESFADLDGHECPPCIEEILEIAVEHPEATEKVVETTVKVVSTTAEVAEKTVSAAGKGAFGAVIFLALQMEGDNAPPKKKDDPNQKDKGKPESVNPNPQPGDNLKPDPQGAEHKKDARPSTREKHDTGQARKKRDAGEEKGDKARRDKGMWPRKRPPGHKGPWPPKKKKEDGGVA
jgi:hypothetical protein